MNYEKIYNDLCKSRKHRELYKETGYEIHHIKPRCMGGKDKTTNLVKLTYKEHFMAHRLLNKIYPENYYLEQALMWFLKIPEVRKYSRFVSKYKKILSSKSAFMKYLHHSKRLEGKINFGKVFKEVDTTKKLRGRFSKLIPFLEREGKYSDRSVQVMAHILITLRSLKDRGYVGISGLYKSGNSHMADIKRYAVHLKTYRYIDDDYMLLDKIDEVVPLNPKINTKAVDDRLFFVTDNFKKPRGLKPKLREWNRNNLTKTVKIRLLSDETLMIEPLTPFLKEDFPYADKVFLEVDNCFGYEILDYLLEHYG